LRELKRDIFDNKGRLLLSKNTKITPNIKNLLYKHGISLTEIDDSLKVEERVNKDIQKLKSHINHRNNHIFSKASNVLKTQIIESREKPWGIYCNALANYIDWLYTHSINVAILSIMIAAKSEYSDTKLRTICLGALFHDVGKLLIPKKIINKGTTLDEFEIQLMRQHCELGKNTLSSYDLDPLCLNIIYQHHERLDGSGYPNGLTSEDIVQEAKIVMIADSIDAMTSNRPYKKACSIEESIKYLEKESNKYDIEHLKTVKEILLF